MTLSRRLTILTAAPIAAAALFLSACGSDDSPTTSSDTAAAPADHCPTDAPAADAKAQWNFSGATGSIAVVGPTDSAAPKVTVNGPFTVAETKVQTLTEGTGPVVAKTASVSVCYQGVNGRDGNVFDSSFQTGTPVDFSLDGVVPGFSKAIAGQKVGSTVAVAMVPADGYPTGNPDAGIEPTDTLIFAIKILSAQ